TEPETEAAEERPEAFEILRLTLTGHPAIHAVLAHEPEPFTADRLGELHEQHADVWPMVHGSRYIELAPLLATLIPELELAVRLAPDDGLRREAQHLLADTYQATAAMMAKLSENDAAWIAADRAAFIAEQLGWPLAVA